MDGFGLIAGNGLALGLASTLHCAGMCGAISCSLLHPEAAYLCLPGSAARSSVAVARATAASAWPSTRRLDRRQTVQRAAVLGSAVVPAAAPASLRDGP